VLQGYADYRHQFAAITGRAPHRFEKRDWAEAQDDAHERILLYDVIVHETLLDLRRDGHLPLGAEDASRARAHFADWARQRDDVEVAETFYNSVVRRLFGTVGVDSRTEFVAGAVDDPSTSGDGPWTEQNVGDDFARLLDGALDQTHFTAPWHQRADRVRRAAEVLRHEIGPESRWEGARLQWLRSIFFRNKGAYLVGRLLHGDRVAPLILALTHPCPGIQLDALLTSSDEASVAFGFTRSYFHAHIDAPRPVVDFLRSIMPLKRVDELYAALGFDRHAKTEFYRALVTQIESSDARFEPAPGQPGLVMAVFTLPELNVVFKVIRDRFGAPKRTTRKRVMDNYRMVFIHDRVGRLVHAQPFERLELPTRRFHPDVLDELLTTAGKTVRNDGETVTIEHLYTERRVRPLDLYLAEVEQAEARRATMDLGQAIKDLAAADIFPGDMLVKNFGVTRHGRVIFYDYDEIAPLSACVVRRLPPPAYPGADMDGEPSYFVGPDDIFPEEWRAFIGPPGPLRQALHAEHPELFDPDWWRAMQERQRSGEVVDFYPYPPERRLDD
jgi:isocitrate dehydrogenase kinase/phosphatase